MYGKLQDWARERLLELVSVTEPEKKWQLFWKKYFEDFVSKDVLQLIWDDMNTIKYCDPVKHIKHFNKKRDALKFIKAFIDSTFPVGKFFSAPDMKDEDLIRHKAYVIWPNDYLVKLVNKAARNRRIDPNFSYTIDDFFQNVLDYYEKMKDEAMLVVRPPGYGPSILTHNSEVDPFHSYAIRFLITPGKIAKQINYVNPYEKQMGKMPSSLPTKKHDNQIKQKKKRKSNYKKKKNSENNNYT